MKSSANTLADGPVAHGQAARQDAYRAARRHSARVRFLRWVIPAGCLLAVAGLFGVMLFDPFSKIPQNLSISAMGLNGTKVTMALPKLSGYRQDGRRYDVRAASGVQDIKVPNVIELNQMEATFQTGEQNHVHVVAVTATYDSTRDSMRMSGNVRVTSDSGFDIKLNSADIDMKAGNIVSSEPVDVTMPRGAITADSLQISNNGEQVTFVGHVVSNLMETGDTPATSGQGRP